MKHKNYRFLRTTILYVIPSVILDVIFFLIVQQATRKREQLV